ncbi:heterokaryon incompatibility protein-domain-containing protein [Xylariaceae sp. AK1471]|nr:heterokaryon incompatibility protein-domain-containing protein [Xylariaceae sp. AK1471]
MADRDENYHRRDRYNYQYYPGSRSHERQRQVKVEYNSDNERERRRRQRSSKRNLSPPRIQRPPLRQETSSSPVAHAPIPKIIVSEGSKSHGSRSHNSGRSWATSSAAEFHAETIPQPTLSPPSSSGVLGEKSYQYEELHPFEFRLVRVFSKKMSAVKCEIIHRSLTDPPPYIAISYAWGDADDKRPIHVGEISIPVAISLFGALDAVRRKGEDVFVWVDALCIDQQNRDERSQQVRLMTEIYSKATEVAIWLGPSKNDSQLAQDFLEEVVLFEDNPEEVIELLSSPNQLRAVEAVVCLFQRDYWKRLWVVQEVFNAKAIRVYCGDSTGLLWGVYERAARLRNPVSFSRALVYDGPNSLLGFDSLHTLGEESLLNVVRVCRRKLTSEPRDKVFGILGVLPKVVRNEFPIDYNLSVKDVYTNVVDFLLYNTERLDVVCESMHFPKQTSVSNLPSWVPDWSQNPETTALGYSYDFTAAGDTNAIYRFLDERRNELEISAVYIDTVCNRGVAVGTLTTLADYLMAFLHWRAIFLQSISLEDPDLQKDMEEAFCRTLCLGQVPKKKDKPKNQTPSPPLNPARRLAYTPREWMRICYHVFATQIRDRLPRLPLDDVLREYANVHVDIEPNPRQFLQSNFGNRMMGRTFFLTTNDRLGMGTGFMLPDDIIIVPLGCQTPIIIRKEGNKRGRYQFVGDVYLDGYMYGEAISLYKAGEKEIGKFVLV